MTKVYEHKANKDYPEFRIKKGDRYWEWKWRDKPVVKSRTYPTPEDLIANDMEREVACWFRDFGVHQQLADLSDIIPRLRELAEGEREKLANTPDNLRDHQNYEARAETLEQTAETLEALLTEYDLDDDNSDYDDLVRQVGDAQPEF